MIDRQIDRQINNKQTGRQTDFVTLSSKWDICIKPFPSNFRESVNEHVETIYEHKGIENTRRARASKSTEKSSYKLRKTEAASTLITLVYTRSIVYLLQLSLQYFFFSFYYFYRAHDCVKNGFLILVLSLGAPFILLVFLL